MNEVTDPALLAILNGTGAPPGVPPTAPPTTPVAPASLADPKVLASISDGSVPPPSPYPLTYKGGPVPGGFQPIAMKTPVEGPEASTSSDGVFHGEVTDPNILAQLNAPDPNASETPKQDALWGLLKNYVGPIVDPHNIPAVGTGLLRAGAAFMGSLGDLESGYGSKIGGLPTTADLLPFVEEHTYQPQGRVQQDVAAAATAAPMAFSRNPALIGGTALGGALGEDATQWPAFSNMNPDAVRAAGNLLVPNIGKTAELGIPLAGHLVVMSGAPKLGAWLVHALDKLAPDASAAVTAAATPDAQTIYSMGQTGEKSAADLDALAQANQEKVWGPAPAPGPSAMDNLSLPAPIKSLAQAMLRYLGSPLLQYEANQKVAQ